MFKATAVKSTIAYLIVGATAVSLPAKAANPLVGGSVKETTSITQSKGLNTGSSSLLAQAYRMQKASVDLSLFCGEQNENGDDEIYVTVSRVFHYNSGQNAPRSFYLWNGDMADDKQSKRQTGNIRVGDYNLAPGDSVSLIVNVMERDGQNYEPGLKLAAEVTTKLGGAIVGGAEGATLGGVNVDDIFNKLKSVFSFVNTDDYIGSFSILIKNEGGNLTWHFDPKSRSRRLPNGLMQLDGDGARYYPLVSINGTRYL